MTFLFEYKMIFDYKTIHCYFVNVICFVNDRIPFIELVQSLDFIIFLIRHEDPTCLFLLLVSKHKMFCFFAFTRLTQ